MYIIYMMYTICQAYRHLEPLQHIEIQILHRCIEYLNGAELVVSAATADPTLP